MAIRVGIVSICFFGFMWALAWLGTFCHFIESARAAGMDFIGNGQVGILFRNSLLKIVGKKLLIKHRTWTSLSLYQEPIRRLLFLLKTIS